MRGRMRIHVMTNEMTDLQADKLEYDLAAQDMILAAKVYERTSDVVITYAGERLLLLSYLQTYYYSRKVEEDETLARSGRAMNRKYWDKLVNRVVIRMGSKFFVPGRVAMTCCADDTRVIGYICKTPLAKTLRHGQWAQATAKVAFEYSKQYRGKGPVFYASEVVPCEAPAEEMVYFN